MHMVCCRLTAGEQGAAGLAQRLPSQEPDGGSGLGALPGAAGLAGRAERDVPAHCQDLDGQGGRDMQALCQRIRALLGWRLKGSSNYVPCQLQLWVQRTERKHHSVISTCRGSTMYFLIKDLSTINHMYRFSLSVFTTLFKKALNQRRFPLDLSISLGHPGHT
eukprot:1157927-Pelagomonas_calceolata.AAC.4